MAEITYAGLDRVQKRTVDSLKKPFTQYAKAAGSFFESRDELKERFMKAYAKLETTVTGGITFVSFVRLLDPTVPTNADEYRTHRAYMAADALRRAYRQRPRGRQGVREAATDGLARTIKTILAIVRPSSHDAIWKAVAQQLNLRDRSIKSLKRRVDATQPLFRLPVKPVTTATVIPMRPKTKTEPQEEEEAA